MKVSLDNYEKEILIETIEFRLDNDDKLILDDRMRDDIKDVLEKVEDATYNISHNGIIVFERVPEEEVEGLPGSDQKFHMDGE